MGYRVAAVVDVIWHHIVSNTQQIVTSFSLRFRFRQTIRSGFTLIEHFKMTVDTVPPPGERSRPVGTHVVAPTETPERTRERSRSRDRTAPLAFGYRYIPSDTPMPMPNDLIPIGKLISSPTPVVGDVSRTTRLELSLETFITDLYRIPQWYIELDGIDDTEAIPRRSIMMSVTPIRIDACRAVHMRMSDQGRLEMKQVLVCPNKLHGEGLPRWLFADLLETALYPTPDQVAHHAWARRIHRYICSSATIHVSSQEANQIRSWTTERSVAVPSLMS